MTPANVTANPARYYAWLQWAMSKPDPRRDNGNHATAPEQTIDGAATLNRDPCHNSFDPSEDKRGFYPAAVSRGAIQGGGGGFTS